MALPSRAVLFTLSTQLRLILLVCLVYTLRSFTSIFAAAVWELLQQAEAGDGHDAMTYTSMMA